MSGLKFRSEGQMTPSEDDPASFVLPLVIFRCTERSEVLKVLFAVGQFNLSPAPLRPEASGERGGRLFKLEKY